MAESKRNDSREVNELTVKLNLDVSEALSGLKAIQREARKATAAMAELTEKTTAASLQFTVNVSAPSRDAEEAAREITESLRDSVRFISRRL